MKKIILTLSILYFSLGVSAQNTFPFNGDVGIGAFSLATDLHVVRGETNAGADYIGTTNRFNH